MDYKDFIVYNEDKPNTLNFDNYHLVDYRKQKDISVPVVLSCDGWFSRCITDDMMEFINDRRVGRGQAPLDFPSGDNAMNEYQFNKIYRCDPDLISAANFFQDECDKSHNRFYIDEINALSFKHKTWNIEHNTSKGYCEGVDVLEENAECAILLEQEENSNSKKVENIVQNSCITSEMIVEKNNLIEKMEIINSDLLKKIRELKNEIDSLKDENIRYEKVKDIHKQLSELLKGY